MLPDTCAKPVDAASKRQIPGNLVFVPCAIIRNRSLRGNGFKSCTRFTSSGVLAREIQDCKRGGTAPLWDACPVKLRGFPATDHMGKTSSSGQAEIRWKLNKRWGLVGFGGVGSIGNSFSRIRDHDVLPSYGVGLRIMVLLPKQIEMRLDFACSIDRDAIHFSVGEAL